NIKLRWARRPAPGSWEEGAVTEQQGRLTGEQARVTGERGGVAGGQARLFRFLIYGLVLASSAAQYAVLLRHPLYSHRFGLSGLQQGMVLGAPGLATLAVSLPAGVLSDRFGARRLTLWAGWLMSVALSAQALAGSFPVLLMARLGFGVGF